MDSEQAAEVQQERQRALIARLKQVPKHNISLKRCAYKVVRRVSKDLKWDVVRDNEASIVWLDKWNMSDLTNLRPYKVGHFPGMWNVSSKCNLGKLLNRTRQEFPLDYDYFPVSFVLPQDKEKLIAYDAAYRSALSKAKASGRKGKGGAGGGSDGTGTGPDAAADSTDGSGSGSGSGAGSSARSGKGYNPGGLAALGPPSTGCWPAPGQQPQPSAPAGDRMVYIVKPDAGSRGNGIYLALGLDDIAELEMPDASDDDDDEEEAEDEEEDADAPPKAVTVQAYLPRPLLIDNKKFDLRIYVLVTSAYPTPRLFIYRQGLVRFATETYAPPDESNVSKRRMFLTNYAVNKAVQQARGGTGDSDESEDEEMAGFEDGSRKPPKRPEPPMPSRDAAIDLVRAREGCKWTLSGLFEVMESQGVDTEALWVRMKDCITKTILAVRPAVAEKYKAARPQIKKEVPPVVEVPRAPPKYKPTVPVAVSSRLLAKPQPAPAPAPAADALLPTTPADALPTAPLAPLQSLGGNPFAFGSNVSAATAAAAPLSPLAAAVAASSGSKGSKASNTLSATAAAAAAASDPFGFGLSGKTMAPLPRTKSGAGLLGSGAGGSGSGGSTPKGLAPADPFAGPLGLGVSGLSITASAAPVAGIRSLAATKSTSRLSRAGASVLASGSASASGGLQLQRAGSFSGSLTSTSTSSNQLESDRVSVAGSTVSAMSAATFSTASSASSATASVTDPAAAAASSRIIRPSAPSPTPAAAPVTGGSASAPPTPRRVPADKDKKDGNAGTGSGGGGAAKPAWGARTSAAAASDGVDVEDGEQGFRCYELMGLDIILDMSHCTCANSDAHQRLSSAVSPRRAPHSCRCQPRPVLLEINQSCSMHSDSDLDRVVKGDVITDGLTLAAPDEKWLLEQFVAALKAAPSTSSTSTSGSGASGTPRPPSAASSTVTVSSTPSADVVTLEPDASSSSDSSVAGIAAELLQAVTAAEAVLADPSADPLRTRCTHTGTVVDERPCLNDLPSVHKQAVALRRRLVEDSAALLQLYAAGYPQPAPAKRRPRDDKDKEKELGDKAKSGGKGEGDKPDGGAGGSGSGSAGAGDASDAEAPPQDENKPPASATATPIAAASSSSVSSSSSVAPTVTAARDALKADLIPWVPPPSASLMDALQAIWAQELWFGSGPTTPAAAATATANSLASAVSKIVNAAKKSADASGVGGDDGGATPQAQQQQQQRLWMLGQIPTLSQRAQLVLILRRLYEHIHMGGFEPVLPPPTPALAARYRRIAEYVPLALRETSTFARRRLEALALRAALEAKRAQNIRK